MTSVIKTLPGQIRHLGGPKMPRPEFRWSRPDMTVFGAQVKLPVDRPRAILETAQAVLELPCTLPAVVAPAESPWLEYALEMEQDPLWRGYFSIAEGLWLFFGVDREPGYGNYRLVEHPGVNQTDQWLELALDMELVVRFSHLADPLLTCNDMRGLEETIERIRLFAEAYGPLGASGALVPIPESAVPSAPHVPRHAYAEPIAYWISEVSTLRALLQLHDALSAGRAGLRRLRESLVTTDDDEVGILGRAQSTWMAVPSPGVSRPLRDTLTPEEIRKLLKEDDTREAAFIRMFGIPTIHGDYEAILNAWQVMLQQVPAPPPPIGPTPVLTESDQLREMDWRETHARAEDEFVGILDQKLSVNVDVRSFDHGSFAYAPLPRNLIGAIYLTLAKHVAKKKRAIRCQECGAPLPDRQRVRKKTANYCDSACRKAAQRRRDAHLG